MKNIKIVIIKCHASYYIINAVRNKIKKYIIIKFFII